MLLIEDGTISLTRGDTAYIEIDLVDNDGEPIVLTEGDSITFSVKKEYDDTEDYVFQKKITNSSTIIIDPQDTKEQEYGRYYYDVQVDTVDGEVFTVVGPDVFKITKEVTQ